MSLTEGLRVGDTVVHSRIMEVTFTKDGYVELHDKDNPITRIGLWPEHKGSDQIEVIKKAKPKVGDVLSGREVLDAQWKRGTTFKLDAYEAVLVLDKDGKLHSSYSGNAWPIEDLDPCAKFQIIHLP